MNNKSNSGNKNNRRIIIGTIIIIIILLLITSCTAINYFGRVGKLTKETTSNIKNNTGEMEIIKNKNLIFDVDDIKTCITINMKYGDYKLGYSIKGIKPSKYGCSTSDSSIATCVVEDGYVRIKPKKKGNVTIKLTTKVNGKKYVTEIDASIIGNKKGSSSKGKGTNDSTNSKNKNKKSSSSSSSSNSSTNSSTKVIAKDKDARLKTLKVDNYSLAPTFNPDIYNYVVTIPSNVDSVTITGKTNSSKSTIISGLGEVDLTGVTTKTVKVKVKAEDGTTKTYTIKINKKDDVTNISSDATLKSIVAGGYSLDPNFKSTTYNYDIIVPYDVTSLDLEAIANDSNALVVVNGNSNFKVGNNKVTINVTAEDGTQKTYTLNVNRLKKSQSVNTNANLRDLQIADVVLNPSFDSETYLYNVTVSSDTNSLNFTSIIPEDDDATYTVSGNSNFKKGENRVNIKVTTKDGISKTYTIIVNKEADTKSKLSSLAVKYDNTNHSLDQTFDSEVTDYTITVPYNISNVDMIYETIDPRATVEVSGNTSLIAGEYNDVLVKVTAEDGVTTTTYTVKVYREEDLSAYYINSSKEYKVGFRDLSKATSEDNYKNIIINSNILDGTVTATTVGNKLILSDGRSTIELESSDLDLEYINDSSSTATHAIKVKWNSTGNKTLKVTGIRKGNQIDTYNITFNVVEIFDVVIDAKTNGGFFNEFADTYNLTFYDGEELDLSVYNEVYKFADKDNCELYKFIGYSTTSNGPVIYPATYDSTNNKYIVSGNITVNNDITLYALFGDSDDTVKYKSTKRLYLTDVDIFVVNGGINLLSTGEYLIYPGAEGAYIMTLNNTTDGTITLKQMELLEDTICADDACLNMGYIVKYSPTSDSNYTYLLGDQNNYHILASDNHQKQVDLNNITIAKGDSVEISLLWQWVHDDNNDAKIGNAVTDTNNKYTITISYLFDKTDTICEE